MAHTTILLYGADEFLGTLFLQEAVTAWTAADSSMEVTMILGGRDSSRLGELGKELNLEARVFECDTVSEVADKLGGVDILVLAASIDKAAVAVVATAVMQADCQAVDLTLDVDVYRVLGMLRAGAPQSGPAWVRGAGPGSGPSGLVVDGALRALASSNWYQSRCIGAIRIALDCVPGFSRASAASAWDGLARDVTIVRTFPFNDAAHPGQTVFRMRCDHVPIGKLERQFDYDVEAVPAPAQKDLRVASAANLVDTVSAQAACERIDQLASRIESYVAITSGGRIAYQVGGHVVPLFNPVTGSSPGKALCRASFDCLPDGPDGFERSREPHTIVVEIEDEERTRVIDWRLRSPNFYEIGARVAVAVVEALATRHYSGLLSPAEVLDDCDLSAAAAPRYGAALAGCQLDRRVTAA